MTKHQKHQQKRDVNPHIAELEALHERQELKQQKTHELANELMHELALVSDTTASPLQVSKEEKPGDAEPRFDGAREEPRNPLQGAQDEFMKLVTMQMEFSMSLLALWMSVLIPEQPNANRA